MARPWRSVRRCAPGSGAGAAAVGMAWVDTSTLSMRGRLRSIAGHHIYCIYCSLVPRIRRPPAGARVERSSLFHHNLRLHPVEFGLCKDALAHQLLGRGVWPIFDDGIRHSLGHARKGGELLGRCLIDVERPFSRKSFGNASGYGAGVPFGRSGGVSGVLAKGIGVVRGEAAG